MLVLLDDPRVVDGVKVHARARGMSYKAIVSTWILERLRVEELPVAPQVGEKEQACCLRPGCCARVKSRGLCQRHYAMARSFFGSVSEGWMVHNGRLLPAHGQSTSNYLLGSAPPPPPRPTPDVLWFFGKEEA